MRILITGGRSWDNYWTINDAILDVCSWQDKMNLDPDFNPSSITVIHGNARGADTLAGEIAKVHLMAVEVYPARWDIYGRGAGPIRNQEMVDSGADICLAFLMPGSVGTADCVKRAEKAGIEVRKYYAEV
jgi:hypothetical protein